MLTHVLAAVLASTAGVPAADATPLDSRIAEVVVYGGAARVRRTAQVPGSGQFLFRALPGDLDADSVQVRLASGSVAAVEVADRFETAAPDAARQQLRERVAALLAEQRGLRDRRDVLTATREHLQRMMGQEEAAHTAEVAAGRPSVEAWKASLQFVTDGLTHAADGLRDIDAQLDALATRLKDAQAGLGKVETDAGVHLRDVIVDVVTDAPGPIDVEYLVGGAGWTPLYDLRTSADARSVDLVYRAKVWQQTGEDWRDASLLLSTAQPQRGAQGPEPTPIKLRVPGRAGVPATGLEADIAKSLNELGYAASAPRALPPAEVIDQGLSVQFRLPRPETIESRDRPSTVLVGQQVLTVEPEHYCTPALDATVWLRGRTRNSTPWTMLPGVASVYFGNDFIGQSAFATPVLPDEEFTLHLGADPGITVERTQVEDLHEEPGFLSRRQTQTEAWRVHIENHAAHAAAADGSVAIIVREALPRSTDERVEVKVTDESVEPRSDQRWGHDLTEQGLHTWIVTVARGAALDITWRVRITWPDDLTYVRTTGP